MADQSTEQSAAQAARTIAAAAVSAAAQQEGQQGAAAPPVPPVPTPPSGDAAAPPVPPSEPTGEPTGEAAPPNEGTVTEEQVEEIAQETGIPFADVVEELAGLGIMVETEDIPESEYDRYDRLLRDTHSVAATLAEQVESTRASQREIEAFKRRMSENPQSILLTLAVSKPEVFDKVKGVVERMGEDPEFKELVIDKLEVEAREARATANEARLTEREMAAKGRRADAMLRSAITRYGVDQGVAEEVVRAHIDRVGPTAFDLGQIDGIVKGLAPKNRPPRPPRSATPEHLQRGREAPSPQSPSPPAAPAPEPATPQIKHMGGQVRGLVQKAAQRVDQAFRGG